MYGCWRATREARLAQVKKTAVREAILRSAFALFSEFGYTASTLPQIARGAGVSPSTVYVYFASKLEILFAIYDPWLRERLERLAKDTALLAEPRQQLHHIFKALWQDIPAEDGGFARNVMQALSTTTPEEGYDASLATWAKGKVADLIAAALTSAGRDPETASELAQIAFMAFDGFALNQHLDPRGPARPQTIDAICALLLPSGPAASRHEAGFTGSLR